MRWSLINLNWKCFRCLKSLNNGEWVHLSSPPWGNVQAHFCTEHSMSIYSEFDEMIFIEAPFSFTVNSVFI